MTGTLRTEISNAGCTVVDCPGSSANKTSQVDQHILVALMNSAYRSAVCLVSSDGDYCHCLNLLRNRRVFTCLCYNTRGSPLNPMLLNSVDVACGVNFMADNDEANETSPVEKDSVEHARSAFVESIRARSASFRDFKLCSTVGTIFRETLGEQATKKLFGATRNVPEGEGVVELLNTNGVQYLRLKS